MMNNENFHQTFPYHFGEKFQIIIPCQTAIQLTAQPRCVFRLFEGLY